MSEYAGWSREERDVYVRRLLPVVARHQIQGRISGLDVAAYKAALAHRPDVIEILREPYVTCFQWVATAVCEAAQEQGHNTLAFVHENNDYQAASTRSFEYIRRKFPMMTLTLTFASKQDCVPLQCADTFAYEGNHMLRDMDAPPRKPIEVMDPSGKMIGYVYWDRQNMPTFAEAAIAHFDELKAMGIEVVDE